MPDFIVSFWNSLSPEMKTTAIVQAVSVATAIMGVMLVVWQIGRQARNARQQTRHTEALKLKMQVYQEVSKLCADATDGEVEFAAFLWRFHMDVNLYKAVIGTGQYVPNVPRARARDLIDIQTAHSDGAIALISFIERWWIIDPRISVFRTAINVAMHDVRDAFAKYFNVASRWMPQEEPGAQGVLFPWHAPG